MSLSSDLDKAWNNLGNRISEIFHSQDSELDESVKIEVGTLLYYWKIYDDGEEFQGLVGNRIKQLVMFRYEAIRSIHKTEAGDKALLAVFGDISHDIHINTDGR